jgi:hypothetical protein
MPVLVEKPLRRACVSAEYASAENEIREVSVAVKVEKAVAVLVEVDTDVNVVVLPVTEAALRASYPENAAKTTSTTTRTPTVAVIPFLGGSMSVMQSSA